ncbi:hypothetical protein DPMN_148675 [Dreissena polymorpha]|uniref:Sushi domain-containing protein n=1 Tax=Dreissena polymorpha TaxID=45954 RepID=A0A9D4FA17_DREPO|nr:hypothetical protein DPMN_148675 [Dreissena polymorpha]
MNACFFLDTVCVPSSLPIAGVSPFVGTAAPAFPVVGDQPVGTLVKYVCTRNDYGPDENSVMAFACASTGVWIGSADCDPL